MSERFGIAGFRLGQYDLPKLIRASHVAAEGGEAGLLGRSALESQATPLSVHGYPLSLSFEIPTSWRGYSYESEPGYFPFGNPTESSLSDDKHPPGYIRFSSKQRLDTLALRESPEQLRRLLEEQGDGDISEHVQPQFSLNILVNGKIFTAQPTVHFNGIFETGLNDIADALFGPQERQPTLFSVSFGYWQPVSGGPPLRLYLPTDQDQIHHIPVPIEENPGLYRPSPSRTITNQN